jgi:hypothetical protein
MKSWKLLFIALLLIGVKPVMAQTDTIPWKDNIKLTWADFKGAPDNASSFFAYTDYMMNIGYSYNESTVSIHLGCYFDRNKSWVRKDKERDSLLMHEQAHFAIAEIFARKARKWLTDTVVNKSNVSDVINAIYSKASRDCSNYQIQYDNETKHSVIYAKQVEWLNKIYSELNSLKAYSHTVVQKNIR